jgi:hypothetical protein
MRFSHLLSDLWLLLMLFRTILLHFRAFLLFFHAVFLLFRAILFLFGAFLFLFGAILLRFRAILMEFVGSFLFNLSLYILVKLPSFISQLDSIVKIRCLHSRLHHLTPLVYVFMRGIVRVCVGVLLGLGTVLFDFHGATGIVYQGSNPLLFKWGKVLCSLRDSSGLIGLISRPSQGIIGSQSFLITGAFSSGGTVGIVPT